MRLGGSTAIILLPFIALLTYFTEKMLCESVRLYPYNRGCSESMDFPWLMNYYFEHIPVLPLLGVLMYFVSIAGIITIVIGMGTRILDLGIMKLIGGNVGLGIYPGFQFLGVSKAGSTDFMPWADNEHMFTLSSGFPLLIIIQGIYRLIPPHARWWKILQSLSLLFCSILFITGLVFASTSSTIFFVPHPKGDTFVVLIYIYIYTILYIYSLLD